MNVCGFPVLKMCSRCGETKPIEEFAISRSGVLGRQAWCRECFGKYHSIRREAPRQGATA